MGAWDAFPACLLACPLGVGLPASEVVPCFRGVIPSSGRVFPAFCPLVCFVLGALLANMPLFRILRRFIWVYRLLVWVCSSWVLCVACGAFVRVNS